MRAKIFFELQNFKRDRAQLRLLFNIQKESYLGFSKAVNRLHRIAHQKDGAAIIRLPTRNNALEDLHLQLRSEERRVGKEWTLQGKRDGSRRKKSEYRDRLG